MTEGRVVGRTWVVVIPSGVSAANAVEESYVDSQGILLPGLAEIQVLRIHLLYQGVFFRARPVLQLLFTCQRGMNVAGLLEIHKLMDMVFFCEAVYEFVFVLVQTAFKVVCYPDVHDLVVPIGKDINIVVVHG